MFTWYPCPSKAWPAINSVIEQDSRPSCSDYEECCFMHREVDPLRRCHTVLKLTQGGHMKMKHYMIFRSSFGSQRFHKDSRSWCWCKRTTTGVHMMAYDALTNGLIFFSDVFMITSKLQDSVRPALQSPLNLKSSLIVCPSGVNFRTVWLMPALAESTCNELHNLYLFHYLWY